MQGQEYNILTLVLIFALFAVVWLASLPGTIARRRRHRNASAISICGIIGAVIWPAWIVAIVWANTADVLPEDKPAVKRKPSGKWRVYGIDEETEMKTELVVEAASESQADIIASYKGIVVSKIEPA